jgi:signal transduction histidine kinase/ActR/RegA family two-component response regulator
MLSRAPIAQRLMSIMLITSGVVLLLVGALFASYDLVSYRRATMQHVNTLGAILAANSTAALAFDNVPDARETLSALRQEQQIVAAVLYDRSGKVFATYPANVSVEVLRKSPQQVRLNIMQRYFWSERPVMQGANEQLGTLWLKADMQGSFEHSRLYVAVTAMVLAVAFFVAVLLARVFQRRISEPILALAHTARVVSDRRDYSVRAPAEQQVPELRTLTDAFNQMLTQVQDAQAQLQAQIARMDLLQKITRAIGDRQDLPSIFRILVSRLEDDVPVDLGCVCRYEPAQRVLIVASVGDRGKGRARRMGIEADARVAIEGSGFEPCLRGELIYQADIADLQAPLAQQAAAAGLRAMVAAPLAIEDRVLGLVIVARLTAGSFSTGDCEFIRQLSEHVALAVNQVGLHEQLQGAFDELRLSQLTLSQQERLRALGQMASGIAHDINNAISPVALYTESLLEQESSISQRGRNYLVTIRRAIDDVAQTVARMREFYRKREPQITHASVDVNRVVRQVLDLTRARWRDDPHEQGVFIDMQLDLSGEPLFVSGADAEIRDALINLIFNAVDAMPEGGVLSVRTLAFTLGSPRSQKAPPDRVAIIEIADTGIGMDDDTRRRCLEPFFTTKGERGTGMGLATVYGMVQRHNAHIEVDSAPGEGTIVRLLFPMSSAEQGAVRTPATIASPAKRLNLLVVDDDPLLLQSLRDTFESEGHTVIVADGGQAGIDAFVAAENRGMPADLVITDLGMPHLDGRAVAASVKAISPQTPVVLLTGWGHRLIADNDMPEHVDRLLSKPPKLADLRAALAELTAAH